MASKLPVHPVWYNAIVEAHKLGCSDEMISIAALATTQNSIFWRPHGARYIADAARARFVNPLSDHMTHLNALHAYVGTELEGNMDSEQWCFDAFLSHRALKEAVEIRKQLKGLVQKLFNEPLRASDFGNENYDINIRKALARSFFYHSALHCEKRGDDIYTTVHGNHPAGIHPDSSLVGINHEWVIYDTFIHTGRQYIQIVTAIDPEWIVDLDHFQDDKLSRKRNGDLRQPNVKASLDKARATRQQATP